MNDCIDFEFIGFNFLFYYSIKSSAAKLGFCIMVLALLMCMLIGVFLSSWYGFILFLIYVGGLLVMFAYVAALILNIFMCVDLYNSVMWSFVFYRMNQILFWFFVGVILILTRIGSCPVEMPFSWIGQVFTFMCFIYFLVNLILYWLWDKVLDF